MPIVLGLVFSIALSGCIVGASTPLADAGKTLSLPWYGKAGHFDPGILDPARASSSTPFALASIANAGLVKFSPDLHVIPELGVSIPTISTDGRTYTFTIRQDARFADGRPCTAEDVAYSFARALSPSEHSPLAAQYLGGIEGARAVLDGRSTHLTGVTVSHRLTVRIRLIAPDATFLEKLAFPVASVISRHGAGGLGPYMLSKSNRRDLLAFVPRPHYFNGPVPVTELQIVAVRDAAQGLDLYRRGQLDAAWVAPDKMAQYSARSDYHSSDSLDAYYAVPPSSAGVWMASVLDRSALIQKLGPGLSSLQSIVPPAVPDYVSTPPSFASPKTPGPPTDLRFRIAQPGNRVSLAIRSALQSQIGAVSHAGSTVWIIHADFLLPDPGRWLGILWSSAPHWYRNSVEQANALTNDPVSRMSTYSDTESWALAHGRIVPLASGNLAWLTRPVLGGMDVTPVGLMPANNTWSLVNLT